MAEPGETEQITPESPPEKKRSIVGKIASFFKGEGNVSKPNIPGMAGHKTTQEIHDFAAEKEAKRAVWRSEVEQANEESQRTSQVINRGDLPKEPDDSNQ